MPRLHGLLGAGVQHPKLTGYRLIVVLLTSSFGLSKAALLYFGFSALPTTMELMSGVAVTVGLYWLGLYQDDPPQQLAWLFEHDYSSRVLKSLTRVSFLVYKVIVTVIVLIWPLPTLFFIAFPFINTWNPFIIVGVITAIQMTYVVSLALRDPPWLDRIFRL